MKQSRKESLVRLLAALVLGILCFIARRWQLNAAFEGGLGLPISMAPATIAVIIAWVLSAAILILLNLKTTVSPVLHENPHLALSAKQDHLIFGAILCSAILTLLAAPTLMSDGYRMWKEYQSALAIAKAFGGKIPGGNNGLLVLATAATSALAFIALLVVAKLTFRGTAKGRLGILLPAINNCLWLMEIYRASAPDPVRWNYVPLLLAIACGILFYLDWAALYAGVCSPRRLLLMAGMTVVFTASALAGVWSFGSAMLLFAQLIAALAVLWCVPKNLKYPPELPAEETPAEEKMEEETHE
jgi:hypothetical protein